MADVPPQRPVHLLISDPGHAAVLAEPAPDGTIRLPQIGQIDDIDEHPPIADLLAGYLGATHPILRVLPVGGELEGRATDILVIAEPLARQPPGTTAWIPLREPRLDGVRGGAVTGPYVAGWLDELAAGVVDPRRQRWERPGFGNRARRWMTGQLEAAGTPVLGEPTVAQLWPISAMLRAETTGGRGFMKACAHVFDTEPAITTALHRAVPGSVPHVIATDAAEGWLLMRDAGGTPVGDQPAETWHVALGALAAIQRATGDGLDGVVLEDRGPTALAASLPALLESPYVGGFPDDIGPRLRAAAPRLEDACHRLASLGPGPTLVHGDFHPWNVLQAGDDVVVIDWSDAAMGHPFIDLATWIPRVADVALRRPMLDAWLACWSDAGSRADLEEAALLALAVGALHQVESYRRIIDSLEPGPDWGLGAVGPAFARWALAFLDDGLAASVPRRA
jgi:Ser/Thr protein kinase RdoA (MazF antagonist)